MCYCWSMFYKKGKDMEQNQVKRLINPTKIKILYLAAKFCFNMIACMEMYYIAAYTTDIAFIPVAITFIPLTIPNIVDFIQSFVNGIILEKMPHPLGKYTFWMGIGPIIASVCYAIVYFRFDNDMTCAVVMCVMIIVAHFFWNIAEITHTSVPSIFTDDQKERSTLSMLQNSGTTWSSFLFGLIAMPIITAVSAKTGAVNNAPGSTVMISGYTVMTIIAGIMYIIGYGLLAVNIRGMEKREEELVKAAEVRRAAKEGGSGKLKGKDMLKSFFQNPPLIILTVYQFCTWIVAFVPMGFQYYFFNCSLGALAMMSVFISATSLAGMFGMLMFPIYQKLFKGSKKRMMLTLSIIGLAWSYIFYIFRFPIMVYLVVSILQRLFLSAGGFNVLAMYSDTATYAQWKTGADSRAFVMSTYTIPLKLALLIRGVITAAILVGINYDATKDPSYYADTFWNVYILMPAIVSTIGWVVMLIGYRLKEDQVTQMALEIEQRANE